MEANALQLDTKKMTAIADDIRRRHQSMYTNIENAKAKIDSLKGTWTGESAEAYQRQFSSLYEKCQQVLADAEKLAGNLNAVVDDALASQKKMRQLGDSAKKLPEITIR